MPAPSYIAPNSLQIAAALGRDPTGGLNLLGFRRRPSAAPTAGNFTQAKPAAAASPGFSPQMLQAPEMSPFASMLNTAATGVKRFNQATTLIDEGGNLINAGAGNPFAAAGQIGKETLGIGNTDPGGWGDLLSGPRTKAKMPTGTNTLAGAGANAATLASAGIGGGTALGFGTTAGTAGALGSGGFAAGVGSGVGAGTATTLPGMGATTGAFNAATSGIGAEVGSAAPTATNSALNSTTNFLSTAPGMGVVAGVLTGLITGNWGKAATVGLGTAGGAALGNMVVPGIGGVIGGALGGLAGNAFGPGPSDESSQTTINFNDGKISRYGSEASGRNRSTSNSIINKVKSWSDLVSSTIPGANFKGGFDIIAGSRDGMRVRYFDNGKRTMLNAGTDPQKFAQNVATGFKKSIHGLPQNVVDAISKVNFSNPALARQQLEHINTTMWTPEARARYKNARRSAR